MTTEDKVTALWELRGTLLTDPKAWKKFAEKGIRKMNEALKLFNRMCDPAHAYIVDGVRYWKSNDAVIPPFVYKDAGAECPQWQIKARADEVLAFTEEYKRTAKPLSGENLAEARANFPKGTVLVDAISGVKTQL